MPRDKHLQFYARYIRQASFQITASQHETTPLYAPKFSERTGPCYIIGGQLIAIPVFA